MIILQAQEELPDVQVPLDNKDLLVHQVNQDSVDNPDLRASRDLLEQLVSQEHQELDVLEPLDHKDLLVCLDHPVLKVLWTNIQIM